MREPLWLHSEPMVEMLNLLVDRLDSAELRGSGKVQSVALSERTWPSLYKAQRESEKETLWAQVMEMVQWGWLTVKPETAGLSKFGYASSPRLTVADVLAVRSAIGRPERVKSAGEQWRAAVNSGLQAPDEVKAVASEFCIEIPGRTMADVVERLNQLPELAEEAILLREVSSRLFWGMSKVLDKRQSLVAALLGKEECPFPDAPIQLHVYLPEQGYRGALFIENLVSFERATRCPGRAFDGLALIYASGFKSSAHRLRNPDGCSLYYSSRGGVGQDLRVSFEAWLFGKLAMPVHFWGDLDWAGMRILASLRRSFPGMQAWEVGYEPMLTLLSEGGGHLPEAAEKQGQKPIASTACAYADEHLLPMLTKGGRFIDQEQVSL